VPRARARRRLNPKGIAMNRPAEMPTGALRNAPKQDLRTWLAQMEASGELQLVRGANREEEIGGIVDFYQRQTNNKAVLFDDIPGYPSGYRAVANILTSTRRIRMTLGLPPDASDMELVQWWRKYMKEVKTIPPVTVPTGLVLQNVTRGDDVNLLKIPAPKWHEHDGGYYIGTGDMVIMRHPDTGWINYGAYRVQVHDKRVATVMCSKGKHGNLIMRRYKELGQKCPVAVVCGMHPALFMIAGLEIPYGKNEYDAAGGLLGEPVETIPGPVTGLPIPANAEIAFEGYVSLDAIRKDIGSQPTTIATGIGSLRASYLSRWIRPCLPGEM